MAHTFQKQNADLESRKAEYWKCLECGSALLCIKKAPQKIASHPAYGTVGWEGKFHTPFDKVEMSHCFHPGSLAN